LAGSTYQHITFLEEFCELSILICDPFCVAVLIRERIEQAAAYSGAADVITD